jgi:hypothetical protein
MPVVRGILLRDCIARPDEGDQRYPLIDHLIAVASGCGRPGGVPEERLAFLAGLSHDAAKAAAAWQHYIRNVATVKDRPHHAPLGAALFAFWADYLVPQWAGGDQALQRRLHDLALDWTRVVYDHHGKLRDLQIDAPPWMEEEGCADFAGLLDTCDQTGLSALVRLFFPDCAPGLEGFAGWLDAADALWERRCRRDRRRILDALGGERADADVPLAPEAFRLARLGARLVFADRSHAAEWDLAALLPADVERATAALEQHCCEEAARKLADGADAALVAARGASQAGALAAYRCRPDALAYSLLLPTGYGKTLNGLRIALEACRTGRCRRLIYVAPYLSILSQSARQIGQATGLDVFVHHHLTAATLDDHQPYDVLDSWQAPVLATTFNQLFRALFPRRAQQCLRIPALDDAFLFIDEPQIVDVNVWNLFLRALAVVGRERRCQVLFCTATLPPTEDGLGIPAVPLAPVSLGAGPPKERYRITARLAPWRARDAAAAAREGLRKVGSVAAILNTVWDAVHVYELAKGDDVSDWFFLAAMMLPGHKAARIATISERLHPQPPRDPLPTGVVCTQVLEAGVDLSFRTVLRALPVFSSVAQAAGRANRHGEEETPAEVIVFPFERDDGRDSRRWVYRDETACRQTDEILRSYPELPESQVTEALRRYYDECRRQNPATACLQQLDKAALGEWSAVADLRPFDDDAPEVEVFVPGADGYLAPEMRPLLARFAPGGSEDLLWRYRDRAFRRSLQFLDRKRFSALMRQFMVGVPPKLAPEIADQDSNHDWLWVLKNPGNYSDETGLAHLLGGTPGEAACVIL